MANYLPMPKKQHVLLCSPLGGATDGSKPRPGFAETRSRGTTVSGKQTPATTFPGSEVSPDAVLPEIAAGDPANPANTFAGSTPNPATPFAGSRRFSAARYHDAICEKLDARLSAQRIWQDLVEEVGYGASYESIKRYLRTLPSTRRAVGVFVCARARKARSTSSAALQRS